MINLIQGDALEEITRFPAQEYACIVTSPPYNIGHHHQRSKNDRRWEGAYPGFNDKVETETYIQYHRRVISELLRVLRPEGLLWYVHRRRPSARGRTEIDDVDHILEGFPVRDEIIWYKNNGGVFNMPHRGRRKDFCYPGNKYESIFLLAPTPEAGITKEIAARGDVWPIPKEKVRGFPAAFPVKLAQQCIAAATIEGPVLDPFMGTGSTAIAARNLGRDCTGIEIATETMTIARQRIALATVAEPVYLPGMRLRSPRRR